MDVNRLKGQIVCNGMTQKEVADKVGVSLRTFNAKLNGRGNAQFFCCEIKALKQILGLNSEQVDEIFFQ